MFEKFYTTGMSAGKRELRLRFTKIRSKSNKKARVMSVIMAAALTLTTVGATVAMAAMGSDGIEHWDKFELYYRDGAELKLNITGKKVPEWVTRDVAGADGDITAIYSRYQTRDLSGLVNDSGLLILRGGKGSVEIASGGWSAFGETDQGGWYETEMNPEIGNYAYDTEVDFHEFPSPGYNFASTPISALVNCPDGGRYAQIHFGYDENYKIQAAYMDFYDVDESGYNIDWEKPYESVKAESISYTGGFEESYVADCQSIGDTNFYFTMYEDNFVNTPNENVSIDVTEATTAGVKLSTDVTLDGADKIEISVYDEEGRCIAKNNTRDDASIKSNYTLTKRKMTTFMTSTEGTIKVEESDIPGYEFVSGGKYRVCAVIFDKDYNVIYRWQKYITLQ